MSLALPFSRLFSICLAFLLSTASGQVFAAASDHEGRSSRYLTVCGDPNNLPFSNQAMQGFENRIAQLIANELERPLHYRWWPQTLGFVRNTLRIRLCDLVMGITSVNEMVQNTNPYYRSVYALVYRRDAGYHIESLQDPRLQALRLGVIAGTPPATLLSRYGLMGQTRPYQRTIDTRHHAGAAQAVHDVAAGELDVALVWGPIAGYIASQSTTPLIVTPLPAKVDSVNLAFSVSMGIRHRETAWKHELNALIERLQARIWTVLLEYNIPLLDQQNRIITEST